MIGNVGPTTFVFHDSTVTANIVSSVLLFDDDNTNIIGSSITIIDCITDYEFGYFLSEYFVSHFNITPSYTFEMENNEYKATNCYIKEIIDKSVVNRPQILNIIIIGDIHIKKIKPTLWGRFKSFFGKNISSR